MGAVLPDVAHLDGAVAAQLLLHRSIPLLGDGGLHMRVPYTERRSRNGSLAEPTGAKPCAVVVVGKARLL